MKSDREFCAGFEGEPEISFVSFVPGGNMVASVRMWVGYFDSIMSTLKPSDNGWTGIALPYHLGEGWYEGGSWTVPDINALISQWSQVDLDSLKHPEREVHFAVAELLTDAKHQGAEVRVLYE